MRARLGSCKIPAAGIFLRRRFNDEGNHFDIARRALLYSNGSTGCEKVGIGEGGQLRADANADTCAGDDETDQVDGGDLVNYGEALSESDDAQRRHGQGNCAVDAWPGQHVALRKVPIKRSDGKI